MPTYDDYSLQEQTETGDHSTLETDQGEVSTASSAADADTPRAPSQPSLSADRTASDESFMPGQAAISSTPTTVSRHRNVQSHTSHETQNYDATPTWSDTIESPLLRLDREVSSLAQNDVQQPSAAPETRSTHEKSLPASTTDHSSATPRPQFVSGSSRSTYSSATTRPITPKYNVEELLADESFGMSPPVMIDMPKVPKLGKTPKKEAAERVMNKLLDIERRGLLSPKSLGKQRTYDSATDASMSSAPTPPSISKYARHQYPAAPNMSSSITDASLDSLMRRVGLESFSAHNEVPSTTSIRSTSQLTESSKSQMPSTSSALPGRSSTLPSLSSTRPLALPQSLPAPSPLVEAVRTPEPQIMLNPYRLEDDQLDHPQEDYVDPDSSSDSIEFEHNDTAHPSAAFLLASERASYDDDDDSSFASSGGDISVDAGDEVHPPVHPFARPMEGDAFDDDSFDDDEPPEEETLFGVPPAQRMRSAPSAQNLRMLGEGMLHDTLGLGRVEESPTPWPPPGR